MLPNVFATLVERLSDGRQFLFGARLTESNIRLFVTVVRFDLAWYGLFECNRKLSARMPQLSRYTARIRALPGTDDAVDAKHIKTDYYSVKALNPTGIVPAGPTSSSRGYRA